MKLFAEQRYQPNPALSFQSSNLSLQNQRFSGFVWTFTDSLAHAREEIPEKYLRPRSWPAECLSRGNTREARDRCAHFKPVESCACGRAPPSPSFRSLPRAWAYSQSLDLRGRIEWPAPRHPIGENTEALSHEAFIWPLTPFK